jgi:hypothetical protein
MSDIDSQEGGESRGKKTLGDLNKYFRIGRSCHLRPGHWAGTTLF